MYHLTCDQPQEHKKAAHTQVKMTNESSTGILTIKKYVNHQIGHTQKKFNSKKINGKEINDQEEGS